MFIIFQLFTISVSAETRHEKQLGSITICIDNESDSIRLDGKVRFVLVKVGEWVNGEYEFYPEFVSATEEVKNNTNAATISDFMDHVKHIVTPDAEILYIHGEECIFHDLEDGLYAIYAESKGIEYKFDPSFVTLPFYDEVNEEMINQIKVFTKYTRHENEVIIPPKTGDVAEYQIPILICFISFSFLTVLSVVFIKRKINK